MAENKPNRALIAAREARGYSQRQLAAHARDAGLRLRLPAPELDAICKQIYRLERGTIARPGDDFYVPALCAALGRTPPELFGEATPVAPADRARGWRVISRKYVPIYLGPDAAVVAADSQLTSCEREWISVQAAQVPYPGATCTLSLFGFGVLVAEIVEELVFSSVAEFAVWRRASYRTARERVASLVGDRWPELGQRAPAYVLSTYRLLDQHWHGDDLHTALRLLCAPGVLLERHVGDPSEEVLARAEVAERVCFRDGFNRPDIETFGIDGVAVGYASWAGVSYLALSPARAISEDEMASFQTVVQALWCYTNMISGVVEAGDDPVVPDEYGWRFVRACLSRLTTARPRENGQHRMMRDAILSTSRLTTQLVDAHAILRDLAPLVGRR
ncbi:helix-turn-helix domain-containing protein [Pseudonocardia sichuanensis]